MFTTRLLSSLLLVILFSQISTAKKNLKCEPSSCGNIVNIIHPFRLKSDPSHCGDHRYELHCENNLTTLYLLSKTYYVQSIDYDNFTIRLVDPGVNNDDCSSLPLYSLTRHDFDSNNAPYGYSRYKFGYVSAPKSKPITKPIFYLSCENAVDSPLYINFSACRNIFGGNYAASNSSRGYFYAHIGYLNASSVRDLCRIDQIVMTSLWVDEEKGNLSYREVHSALVYGFELSWFKGSCGNCSGGYCYLDYSDHLICDGPCSFLFIPLPCGTKYVLNFIVFLSIYLAIIIAGLNVAMRIVCGIPLGLMILICKWKRRHLSMFDEIEDYLRSQYNLTPIRYSYSQIKKMANSFKDKLGEGGYGSVYKGQLRNGRFVAIKILEKSKANGEEFINEVATIGRIHHVNVVQLIGYCSDRSQRALVYEFMPNGSLDKYIFRRQEEDIISISCGIMYLISLGVARGIEYLHRGCDIQILHFDIKPNNILIDQNFTPKISDFGLAKLCPTDDSIVSLTAARGTTGYMAPELFYKNIGGVSYKADVYSFGMLLMEMVGRRKNLNAFADNSSEIYFPSWVYDQMMEGKDIEVGYATEDEAKAVKKMIIVALWCIQMKPSDRPSMSKVVEMLEGNVEVLQMPPKPFLSPLWNQDMSYKATNSIS